MSYHEPVLLKESVDALNIKEGGIYADVTFGGGGHSREILKRLKNGKLLAFDQDADAARNVEANEQLVFIPQNFRHLKPFCKAMNAFPLDGILADLGVSSHQFDTAERGFSFRFDAPLDMRMSQNLTNNAADIIQQRSEHELQQIFGNYGEVRNARTLAKRIVEARQSQAVKTIADFLSVIEPCIIGNRAKYLAQVFQALRIEVNEEMQALEELLQQSAEVLKPGGRLVVISYHSLEDRMVKNFMKAGNISGEIEKDLFGNFETPFKVITKKPVEPSEEEIKMNSRARSARMRVAEKP